MEFLVRKEIFPSALFPAPSMIIEVFSSNSEELYKAFTQSFSVSVKAFLLSFLIGILASVIFSLSEFTRRSILPFAIFFQTVPIIAVAPLLVIYFGFGEPTVLAASFIVSIFPILANTLMGLHRIDKNLADLFQIYNASSLQKLIKLQLPSAYPYIFTGLKVSAGLAIIGTIAGEFVAGGGLGALIDSARTQQRVDIVFACILLLSLMGLIFVGALNLLNYGILKIRPFVPKTKRRS